MNVTEARYYLKLRTTQRDARPTSPTSPLPPMHKCDRDAIETVLAEIHRLNRAVSIHHRTITAKTAGAPPHHKPAEKKRNRKPAAPRNGKPTIHKTEEKAR